MPLDRYYDGKGKKVMAEMKRQYGAEKGKRVFYATENKRKKTLRKRPRPLKYR
jgi:hypothetical protein